MLGRVRIAAVLAAALGNSLLAGAGPDHVATTPAAANPSPNDGAAVLKWRMVGPFRGGRTRAVSGVASRPDTFYVGAVDGGVWKTDDAGRTWQPMFEGQSTQSIGAIAVAPSNPDIVYVGSGEGLHRPDLSVGDGVYRSADGGRTWRHLGLSDGQQIPDLAVDPRNPDRVFAAVLGHPYGSNSERGIFRSTDGGASWQRVLFKDADTGGSAVAVDPANPNIVYAALWQDRLGPWEDRNQFQGTGGGLFKSTDGGDTWRQLSQGLPANTTQVNFSIAASRPGRLMAVVGTNEPGTYSSAAGLGVFRSDDGGENWTRATSDPRPALRIGGGDLPIIRIDPSNPEVVYSTGLVTMRSVDGGQTWTPLRGAPGGDDYQNLWIDPSDGSHLALVSDQGAVVSVNGGRTWSSWFNQPTAQLYHVSVAPGFPYRLCAGQQESGSVCIASRGNDGSITGRDWHPVGVIEYGYVAPDPLNANVIYGAGRNEVSEYHIDTGQVRNITPIPLRDPQTRVDRTEPLVFSPQDPHVLYYAANRIYRTRDGGQTWDVVSPDLTREQPGIPPSVGAMHAPGMESQRGSIYSLGLSPLNGEVLWAGTDDGLIWRSSDGGRNWSDITPPGLTPWSKVTQIDASHFDEGTAYVSVSRMRVDDMQSYIFRTRDSGRSWTRLALPEDQPVNTVREDPKRRGLLFAATERSVWMSADDGAHWSALQLNLPHTSMRDLLIHDDDLIVATHGRSIWILDDITPLRRLAGATEKQVVLVDPRPAYRVPLSTWTDTPIPPDEPLGENPPAGAVIDYFLPRDAKHPVTLEIFDGKHGLVRRFRSHDPPANSDEELARELIPAYWIAPNRSLEATPGVHRWVWDLHYPDPQTNTRGYPISAVPHRTVRGPRGPLALPGRYLLRLTADGHTVESQLDVLADPRVKSAAGSLERQFELATGLAAALGDSTRALLAAQSEHDQLQSLTHHASQPELTAFDRRLSALLDEKEGAPAASLTEVQGHIDTLYKETVRGDGPPTESFTKASQEARAALVPLLQSWEKLQRDLPALNRKLRAANLPPVRPDLPPPRDLNAADED